MCRLPSPGRAASLPGTTTIIITPAWVYSLPRWSILDTPRRYWRPANSPWTSPLQLIRIALCAALPNPPLYLTPFGLILPNPSRRRQHQRVPIFPKLLLSFVSNLLTHSDTLAHGSPSLCLWDA